MNMIVNNYCEVLFACQRVGLARVREKLDDRSDVGEQLGNCSHFEVYKLDMQNFENLSLFAVKGLCKIS